MELTLTRRPLPTGQREQPWRPFGNPAYAGRDLVVPDRPVLTLSGAVRRPQQVAWADLVAGLPTVEQHSDLHCVTTWTATGLHWAGIRFRDLHERLVEVAGPETKAGWVTFHGLDGYRSCLRLDDALREDVLMATGRDGRPLDARHGGPLRLVAPAQYGYKSAKHVCRVDYVTTYDGGERAWMVHPRARVDHEERSRGLPGWVYRRVWRALLPRVAAEYDRQLATRDSRDARRQASRVGVSDGT